MGGRKGGQKRTLNFESFALRTGAKLAEIGWNFIETQRKEHTRLQVSLFQFISRYSPEFRVLILYHCNPIQTLIWHPVAWASCDLPNICQISNISTNLDPLGLVGENWKGYFARVHCYWANENMLLAFYAIRLQNNDNRRIRRGVEFRRGYVCLSLASPRRSLLRQGWTELNPTLLLEFHWLYSTDYVIQMGFLYGKQYNRPTFPQEG